MRYYGAFMFILLVAILGYPYSGYAFDNNVALSLESGSGEDLGFNYEVEGYSLAYTRYLQGLTDDGSPYGAREFLQHPSSLSFEWGDREYRIVSPASTESRREYTDFVISGNFYFGDGRNTGFGARYGYSEGELSGASSLDIRENRYGLTLVHYLVDSMSLTFDYDRTKQDKPYGYEWATHRLRADVLMEKFWLSAWYHRTSYNYMDEPRKGMGAELGVYPLRELGVFASCEFLAFNDSVYKVRADYWLSDAVNASLLLKRTEDSWEYFAGDSATLTLKVLF